MTWTLNMSQCNSDEGGHRGKGISSSRGKCEAIRLLHRKSNFPRDPKRWTYRRGLIGERKEQCYQENKTLYVEDTTEGAFDRLLKWILKTEDEWMRRLWRAIVVSPDLLPSRNDRFGRSHSAVQSPLAKGGKGLCSCAPDQRERRREASGRGRT